MMVAVAEVESAQVSLSRCVLAVLAVSALLLASTAFPAVDEPPGGAAATSSSSTSPPLPEVTITGRLALQRHVASFVNGIMDLENEEGVPRWDEPVCPLVAGLPREEGEFILGRISEVARAAQVPLAKEQCLPNFYVLVSADPQRDLQGLHERSRLVLFGYAPPPVVEEFLARPRAVKVWYTKDRSADGKPVGGPLLDDRKGALSAPVVSAPPGGSHLRSSVVYGLRQVFVIVDQRRLRGVSRTQFADYVAMVGLAQIKPEAHLGGAETILRLFDAAPEAAPGGISAWDRAFLKALYATDPLNKMQRDDMARIMLGELAPDPGPSRATSQ